MAGARGPHAVGLLSVGLVASSNYVLNEILDAATDRYHPDKSTRPVPSGLVDARIAYVQWAALAVAGIALGYWISRALAEVLVALWMMGCVYNMPPVRTKDVPYLDVLSEAVNNPLRMLVGWFIVGPDAVAPASLLVSYWMVGCYFMAMKRFAERPTTSAIPAARAVTARRSAITTRCDYSSR